MLTKGQFDSRHLTVTRVEGAPGSEQPVHAHEQEQVYVMISGRGIMCVGDEVREVEAGTLISSAQKRPGTPRVRRSLVNNPV